MGNPHAVQWVADVDAAPVLQAGARIESHPRFARRVNAGFAQVLGRGALRLRVFARQHRNNPKPHHCRARVIRGSPSSARR